MQHTKELIDQVQSDICRLVFSSASLQIVSNVLGRNGGVALLAFAWSFSVSKLSLIIVNFGACCSAVSPFSSLPCRASERGSMFTFLVLSISISWMRDLFSLVYFYEGLKWYDDLRLLGWLRIVYLVMIVFLFNWYPYKTSLSFIWVDSRFVLL